MIPVASVQVLQKARPGLNIGLVLPLGLKFAPLRRNRCWTQRNYSARLRARFLLRDRKFWLGHQNLVLPRGVDFTIKVYLPNKSPGRHANSVAQLLTLSKRQWWRTLMLRESINRCLPPAGYQLKGSTTQVPHHHTCTAVTDMSSLWPELKYFFVKIPHETKKYRCPENAEKGSKLSVQVWLNIPRSLDRGGGISLFIADCAFLNYVLVTATIPCLIMSPTKNGDRGGMRLLRKISLFCEISLVRQLFPQNFARHSAPCPKLCKIF